MKTQLEQSRLILDELAAEEHIEEEIRISNAYSTDSILICQIRKTHSNISKPLRRREGKHSKYGIGSFNSLDKSEK